MSLNFKKVLYSILIIFVLFFTAACGSGKADRELLEEAKTRILLSGQINNLTENLDLPTFVLVGEERVEITWTASDSEYFKVDEVDAQGFLKALVTRPAAGEDQAEVTLTATLHYKELTTTRDWTVYVRPLPSAAKMSVYEAKRTAKSDIVEIEGTVIARLSNGIFVQDNTEAMFVFTSGAPAEGAVPGAIVKVTGEKDIYYGMPQLSKNPSIEILTPAPSGGFDYSVAQEATHAEILNASSENMGAYGKLLKITGKVEKGFNTTFAQYSIYNSLEDLRLFIYNSSVDAAKAELEALVGKYVTLVVIVYDFHSTQLIWRNLAIPGTVEEIDEPVIPNDVLMVRSKTELTNLLDGKQFASDLTLPLTTAQGATVTWSSDDTDVIANDGTFTAPIDDTTVLLTATITIGEGEEALTETLEVTVTAKAMATSTVKQAIDAIDAANALGNTVPLIKMVGVVIGIDADDFYYLADETAVIFVRHKVAEQVKVGDLVEVVGTGKVFNNTSQFTRQIDGNYSVKVLESDKESPLEAIDLDFTDLDFTIVSADLKTKVPEELLLGQLVRISGYVIKFGTFQNFHLATSLDNETSQKILVHHKSVELTQFDPLVGTWATATFVLLDYHTTNGWRLGFLGRDGDIITNLTDEDKLVIAEKEIEAIVKDGADVNENLNFITETAKSLISGTKYVWTTDDLTTIDAEGAFTAPDVDKAVKITVNVFLNGDVTGDPDATLEINVTAKAPGQEVLKYHFDFGTTTNFGYSVDGRDITLTNLAGGELIAKYINAQLGSSTFDPHKDAGAFSVLGIHRNAADAAIEFTFDNEVTRFEFDFTWWSPADSNNADKIDVLAVQVWNQTTSTWVTVKDFKADLDNSQYKTLSVEVNSTKVRFFGSANSGEPASTGIRIAIDNLKIYG